MYLFDTDTLSNLFRPRPIEGLLDRFAQVPTGARYTSAINAAELLFGAERSPRRDRLMDSIAPLLSRITILPFDSPAAAILARTRAELERRGAPLAIADLMIAAVALVHDLTVVTGNVAHFARVPNLRVEDWIRES